MPVRIQFHDLKCVIKYRESPDSTDSLSTVPALEHFFHKIDHLCNQIQANLIKPISPQCGT